MHLQSSSKFLELLKSAGKRVLTSRDMCRTWRVPGGGLPVGVSGHVAHSDGVSEGLSARWARDTWRTRNAPGVSTGWGHSGHVVLDLKWRARI